MKKHKKNLKIDKSWTLFLDRDGIINKHIKDGYVLKWSDFKFIPDFLKIIPKLSNLFDKIIIVTNQRCVAKKLISKSRLETIHEKMLKEIKTEGGRIDKIFYCPHEISDKCKCRKPKTGMAVKAKKEFKNINFLKSIMIGDSESDVIFGNRCKMITVYCTSSQRNNNEVCANYTIKNLKNFLSLINNKP